eukprot:CAMPEP_0115111382 /NCGR_PEP_ID=MMETSP0227-20121206/39991_1 /TAXON_ID=89957 /ORGANISM="Polarella glacialis, Strain CCMP 1383" /LENGTH=45 /DNA_ID= /DNA_START= /DNA_END= /DNA_ORIENTATION=
MASLVEFGLWAYSHGTFSKLAEKSSLILSPTSRLDLVVVVVAVVV